MCIPNGSLSLLSILFEAGTAFIVQQKTLSWGEYRDKLPGNTGGGAVIGISGRMSRLSIIFTTWRFGSFYTVQGIQGTHMGLWINIIMYYNN